MNYEIAKKLKRAGFPQEYFGGHYIDSNNKYTNPKMHLEGLPGTDGQTYVPTLEELIEACGDDFHSLQKKDTIWCSFAKASVTLDCFVGSTPLEAVANLWLALHGTRT